MKILEEHILYNGKWVQLKERIYIDTKGNKRSWTFIGRRNQQKASVIVPVTKESGALILIQQYRIPFGQYLYEFPAGLIDPGEKPEEAAIRELSEETGYQGKVDRISPEIASSSGLASETIYMVYMTVEEEPSMKPEHEGSEKISVFKLLPRDINTFIENCVKSKYLLDAKLYVYLVNKSNMLPSKLDSAL